MKKHIITLALGMAIALPALANEYKVDSAHSNVNFTIKHLFSKVSGSFDEYEGKFTFDDKKPAASAAEFSIKTASISTKNGKRDEHLKSADFFDAEKNPAITFKSTKVAGGGKKFKVTGDLTLHGVTKPVTFDVEYLGTDTFMGTTKASFSAKSKIKRKDFGIVWNKKLDSGNFVLGEDVDLELQIEGDKI